MITSLIAGTAVPSWDTELVRALNDAVAGIGNESEILHYKVVNDEGEAYRRLVVEGPAQHAKILECLHGRGFHVISTPHVSLIRRTGVAFP